MNINKHSDFQFAYHIESNTGIGGFKINKSLFETIRLKNELEVQKMIDRGQSKTELFYNYGEDIRTLRLVDNIVQDLDKILYQEEQEKLEEQEQRKLEQEEDSDSSREEKKNSQYKRLKKQQQMAKRIVSTEQQRKQLKIQENLYKLSQKRFKQRDEFLKIIRKQKTPKKIYF